VLNELRHQPSLPSVFDNNEQALSLESTLRDLRLYHFQAELSCLGGDVAQIFEQHPRLPGVILVDRDQFVGMISRRQFLECLIRPHGWELFLQNPLQVLHSYTRSEILLLSENTSILVAAQFALRRSPELLNEPIVVQTSSETYLLLDQQELNIAAWQIRGIETQVRYERTQVQLVQSDKMGNLGRLVDGLAHEILDPVSFIWGNLSHVSAYSESLMQLLKAYEAQTPKPNGAIAQLKAAIEFDFLQEDLPRAIASIQLGATRLKKLTTSLQTFCHIDEVHPKPADLHECIDSILLLLKSRLSSEIEVVKYYAHLPPVVCYIGQLSQVFMNVLSHAIDALLNQAVTQQVNSEFKLQSNSSALVTPSEQPRIEITTRIHIPASPNATQSDPHWVAVCIADNGPGLSAEEQQQLLESFSVKRRAAKETSLAVSYQIVTAKHGGQFLLRSQPGSGTVFEILLPLV
jgi:signal transduction histidine kinase